MKNIILTGFMGTGKSSAGRRLARELNYRFVNTDDLIEKEVGLKVSQIFEEFGEPYFREIEKRVIKEVASKDNQIISTGGGAIVDEENLSALKASGIVICLTASTDAILLRVGASKGRPLLNQPDKKGAIEKMLEYRKPFYAKADFCIDTTNKRIDAVAAEIKERIVKSL